MARLISKTWEVETVLTDVASAKMSDPTGTYGVKRNDLSAKSITAATQADPVVLTAADHGLSDGQMIHVSDVVGMVELNGNQYYVDALTSSTLALYSDSALSTSVDGSGYAAYTSDGTETPVEVADGTDMTQSATGTYEYLFTDVVDVVYTAYVEIVYGGATYHFEVDLPARLDTGGIVASYFSLLERVGHHLFGIRSGYSADQTNDIKECIRDGLRRVYSAHNWSFFRPVETITTEDGTATYSLPAGYESIESEMHYAPGESDFYPPIRQRYDSEIRKRQQDDDDTDRPLFFSIRTVEFDPTTGSRRQLVLYPTPDDEYVLSAKMTLRATMIDETNCYPIGGEVLSGLIIEACLAAAEDNYDEASGVHTQQFEKLLPSAIAVDSLASSPTQLGPDAPKGERTDLAARAVLVGDITLDGTIL